MKKLTTWIVTQEHAEVLRGPLKWLKENHPQKKFRDDATNILRALRFEDPSKQIILTMREKETLQALHTAFPEACTPPRQLGMDLPVQRNLMNPGRNKADRDAYEYEARHTVREEDED